MLRTLRNASFVSLVGVVLLFGLPGSAGASASGLPVPTNICQEPGCSCSSDGGFLYISCVGYLYGPDFCLDSLVTCQSAWCVDGEVSEFQCAGDDWPVQTASCACVREPR